MSQWMVVGLEAAGNNDGCVVNENSGGMKRKWEQDGDIGSGEHIFECRLCRDLVNNRGAKKTNYRFRALAAIRRHFAMSPNHRGLDLLECQACIDCIEPNETGTVWPSNIITKPGLKATKGDSPGDGLVSNNDCLTSPLSSLSSLALPIVPACLQDPGKDYMAIMACCGLTGRPLNRCAKVSSIISNMVGRFHSLPEIQQIENSDNRYRLMRQLEQCATQCITDWCGQLNSFKVTHSNEQLRDETTHVNVELESLAVTTTLSLISTGNILRSHSFLVPPRKCRTVTDVDKIIKVKVEELARVFN